MSTSPNYVNGPIGTVLQDTATLTGSAGATGSIEFKLYATADCSGPPVDDETVTVTGDGSYATTTGYTAAAAGTYQWTASYSGDTNNNPAASGCGAEQVGISSSPSLYWADGAGNIVADPVIGVTGGAPAVLASGQNDPVGVMVNGGTVYWADSGAGTIMAVPVTGGTTTVLASGQNDPAYVAVDDGTVYWADSSAGTVMAVPVTGGTATVLASGQPDPAYLAASGGFVYWVDRGIHTIMESPETGGTYVPAALVNDPGGPAYLAADSGFVYWADSNTGQVMAIRTTGLGGTPFVLASGEDDPAYVTANSGAVYWTDLVSGAILTVTVTDGIPSSPDVLASDQNGPAYVAADNGTVYWIDGSTGTIVAVPAAGGTTPSVVAGASSARRTWRWANSEQRPGRGEFPVIAGQLLGDGKAMPVASGRAPHVTRTQFLAEAILRPLPAPPPLPPPTPASTTSPSSSRPRPGRNVKCPVAAARRQRSRCLKRHVGPDGPGHGLAAAPDAKPLVDRDGVVHDGLGGHAEAPGDLFVGEAASQEPDDVELSAGERLGWWRDGIYRSLRRLRALTHRHLAQVAFYLRDGRCPVESRSGCRGGIECVHPEFCPDPLDSGLVRRDMCLV